MPKPILADLSYQGDKSDNQYLVTDDKGNMCFEGTIRQFDDCFGISRNCQVEHVLRYCQDQNLRLWQRVQ